MKKLVALFLVLSMTVSLFSGCGRSENAETIETTTVSTSETTLANGGAIEPAGYRLPPVDPNLSPTGKKILQPETGPVGSWDIPVPYINPLGSQSLYTGGTEYRALEDSGTLDIQYIENYTEYQKRLSGDVWYMRVDIDSGLPSQFLKDYAVSIGGEVYSSVYADHLILKAKQPDAIWWCDAVETDSGYEFRIARQNVLEAGKSYTFEGAQFANGQEESVSFVTESTGMTFQTIQVSIPSGKFELKAECIDSYGDSTVYKRFSRILDSKISNDFLIDDFPQGVGIYDWRIVQYGNEEMPTQIIIQLAESYALSPIKSGADPGALLVKGAPFGTVFVEPQRYVGVDFREGTRRSLYGESHWIEGTITPNGDTLFSLPPGYWAVVNNAPYMNYGSTKTQLVPVSSGEQTTLVLPDSLKSANARLNSMADDSELTGSITLDETKDNITTADLTVSVSDPLDRDISPTKENTVIYEGGQQVQVTNIARQVAPSSIALVIDSSGSMKNDMKATLEAAKAFLGTLPSASYVKVIDFDKQVRVLKGETAADAIKALAGISAGGNTKLYDATVQGIELVKGKSRPAVVVFTDGVDSREEKGGGGSTLTRSGAMEKVKVGGVPVYTIGFGKRLNAAQQEADAFVDGAPDIQCLLEFAEVSEGQYYPAKDPAALTGVFTAISSKLGNNFVITYTRPTENSISQTPFVSMVVDNSGSMNMPPEEGKDTGFRMEKTISLFHTFLNKLPQDAMMQFTTFQTPPMSAPLIVQQQITTLDKATILKSLGEMKANGGTPIVEVLRTAYENILPVPSSRKVILFLTDGGLEVEPEQLEQYNSLLAKIKEKNITILFVGMGAHSKQELFSGAAAASGGDYVISEDINEIQQKLDKLLAILKEPVPQKTIPISLSIGVNTPEGEALEYAVADEVAFSAPKKAGIPLKPDVVSIKTGIPYQRYDAAVASSITGMGAPTEENILLSRMEINKTIANKAMSITVKQEAVFSKYMGVDGERSGLQFVALALEMENKTSGSIPYQIPSLFNHFYIGVNNEGLYPASKGTWLAEKPISPHGNPEILLAPGEKRAGVVVFVVPESKSLTQQSLHFYDTNNGHIQIPITGKMPEKWVTLEKLPATAPTALSDTFSMEVTASSVVPKVAQYEAGEQSAYRVVEAKFQSKVQAILRLDPKERIWLKLDTSSGSLMAKMSNATAAMPFGFLEPVMMGPAANNPVRFAFDLPAQMAKYKSTVYMDLATGKSEFPVNSGEIYSAPKAVATAEGEQLKVVVNQLTVVNNEVWLDMTIADIPGNDGVQLPDEFCYLVNKNYEPPVDNGQATAGHVGLGGANDSGGQVLAPSRETQELVFGIDGNFGVFEGQSRRGIVIFQKPGGALSDWTLQSPYVPTLNVPITQDKFASPELIGKKKEIEINREFTDALDKAVSAAVEKFRPLSDAGNTAVTVSLSDTDGLSSVPMPNLSSYGLEAIQSVTTEAQALALLSSLRVLPINRNTGYLQTYGYAPEAIITQGWGEIGDVTNLTKRLMSRLGFSPRMRALALTETGKKWLMEQTGIDPDRERTTPMGVAYQNTQGERKMLVVPFMMDLSELIGYVYYPSEALAGYMGNAPQEANIRVYAQYIPGEQENAAAAATGDAGASLGGGEGGDGVFEKLMLEKNIPLGELSMDAIDLTFMPRNSMSKAKSYSAVLSWTGGIEPGAQVLESPKQVLGIKIVIDQINGIDPPFVHYNTLAEGDSLDNYFHTIAINLPDLTEAAASRLDELTQSTHSAAKNPNPISVAKWYGRSILYRMISGQSMFDQQMVQELKLTTGRIQKPRCMVVVSHLDKKGTLHTSVDLIQPFNEIHSGEETARQAYHLATGFYMSTLEADALPGDNKVGYLDLWAEAPSGTTIECIPAFEEGRDDIYQSMLEQNKFPYRLLESIKENKKLIFAPTTPTLFGGQERWAWLEIDPDTYQAISVFDTGLHSATAEVRTALIPSSDDTMMWMNGIWLGNLISVWSMGISSLKFGDDYAAVLKDAKATAEAIAKTVDSLFNYKEIIDSKSYSFKMDVGGHQIDFNVSMQGFKTTFKQNVFNLSGGLQLAIDTYFKVLVPKPPEKNDKSKQGGGK